MDKFIYVVAKEPMIKSDPFGFTLDISRDAYTKSPDRVYKIPDNAFWHGLILAGRLLMVAEPAEKREVAKKKGEK